MSQIPLFSIFSAVSEVPVTIGIVWCVVTGLRTGVLPRWPMGVVLLFELCVNIVYMVGRAGASDRSGELSSTMKLFLAFHGTLSLGLFILLGAAYLGSLYGETLGQKNWFHRHPGLSWGLIAVWMVSVCTGEGLFVARYLL